ncbi:MAG TPA: DoxX family protein [Microbacteriaceae bacterium]|nr:DoxX family protein [Microbacteriaceae bacterium]
MRSSRMHGVQVADGRWSVRRDASRSMSVAEGVGADAERSGMAGYARSMYVAWMIVSFLLSLACLVSAAAKLRRVPQVIATLQSVGVKDSQVPILAGLQIAAAFGLVMGVLLVPFLAPVTAGALAVYFLVGTVLHWRAGHRFPAPTIVLFLVSVASLWLGLAG